MNQDAVLILTNPINACSSIEEHSRSNFCIHEWHRRNTSNLKSRCTKRRVSPPGPVRARRAAPRRPRRAGWWLRAFTFGAVVCCPGNRQSGNPFGRSTSLDVPFRTDATSRARRIASARAVARTFVVPASRRRAVARRSRRRARCTRRHGSTSRATRRDAFSVRTLVFQTRERASEGRSSSRVEGDVPSVASSTGQR